MTKIFLALSAIAGLIFCIVKLTSASNERRDAD